MTEQRTIESKSTIASKSIDRGGRSKKRTEVNEDELREAISLELELLSEIDYRLDPKPGQREGVAAVRRLIAGFTDQAVIEDPALLALILIRLRDLQVRDFALGCMDRESLKVHVEMWRWVVRIAPTSYLAPPATLLSATAYEVGDEQLAREALTQALEADEEYPLALLLKRVFAAGWPAETFATMRTELHPKITAAIFDES